MVFSSAIFLGIFLPVVIGLYFLFKNNVWRNMVLLLASLIFYAWGEPKWVFAMIALTFIDYIGGLIFPRVKNVTVKKLLLALWIVLNLVMLFMFKYLNFFIDNINAISNAAISPFPYAMPIGISFFTFQALTYVIDVYRERVPPQKNFLYVLLYISMFPQLIAGPIVRYIDIAEQIKNRQETTQGFINGSFRFAVGLAKKVVFANYAGAVATSLMTTQYATLSASGAWIGLLMYTFQIYFDFSGYSDMAIGLGKIFGFEFKENFNYPYIARSVTDFWRRWHMSLSTFFRDYVYIPLGGNRKHQYLNILIVWALTGLWHGANWNFILWGLYYAVLLVVEKALSRVEIEFHRIPIASNVLLLLLVMFGWGIFYYTDLSQVVGFTRSLFGLNPDAIVMSVRELTSANQVFYLVPFMLIGVTPIPKRIAEKVFKEGFATNGIKTVLCILLIVGCYILTMKQSYNPFLYFRF